MNQTFNKKVLAACVGAALSSGGAAYANVFADSTASTPTAGIVVKGGALKMTPSFTLTETGTYTGAAGGASQPIGVRLTIPAGLSLYGAKLSAVPSVGNINAQSNATALSLTTGTTYALRLVSPHTTGTGAALGTYTSFVVIDTNTSSANSTNMLSGSTITAADSAALYALFTANSSNLSDAATVAANGFTLLTGGLGSANTAATNGTSFFAAGGTGTAIFSPNQAGGSTSAIGTVLRQPNGSLPTAGSGNPVGSLTANSDGTMTMVLYTSSVNTTANNGDTLVVPQLAVGVGSSSTASGSLAIGVTDGPSSAQTGTSNLVGITNASVNVLTVASSGIAVAKNVTTSVIPTDVQGLANQAVDPIKVTFATPITAAKNNTVTLTLDNNAKFVSGTAFTGNISSVSANAFIRDAAGDNAYMFNSTVDYNATNCANSANTSAQCASGVLTNNNATLTLTMDNEAINAGDSFLLTGSMLDLTSAGTGAINLTVTSGTSTSTIQVANVAAKGATVSLKDNSPTGYTTLFSGRTAQSTTDALVLTEAAAGSLSLNGAITVAASNGALFTANVTPSVAKVDTTATGAVLAVSTMGITGTASASLSGSVTTASGTAYKATMSGFTFDLSSATAGDLTLTVAGGAGVSGSQKIATITNATNVSAGGTLAVGSAGSIVTLPDIVITEQAAGAIVNGAQATVAVSTSQVSGFDTTGATVKAYDASGTDISTTIFGASSATVTASTQGSTAYARFSNTNASSGAITIKISGLKATLASTATGSLALTVGGAASTTPDLSAAAGSANEISSNVGAKLTKATVTVGSVVSAGVGYYPAATVTGAITSQNISVGMVPAGNDQGKQGSIFVAAVVPNSGVFFMNSSKTWTQFSTCAAAPAYSTGTLAAVSDVSLLAAAADLTSLKGTEIYIGYGVGGALSPAGTACNNMLNGGTYNKSYTIN